MAIAVEVWGDYAAFNRPELKTERVSYECMTPSAARGILESIYWHPGLRWIIDKICVCNPVKQTNIRRNEVKSKISANNVRTAMNKGNRDIYLSTSQDIQQRAALVLKDVRYVIFAHFEMTENANETDNPGKFQDIMKRRLRKGQCYHMPYLGVREFPASFRLWDEKNAVPTAVSGSKDLGYMLYDMDYQKNEKGEVVNIEPTFFHAVLENGVLDLTDCEVLR